MYFAVFFTLALTILALIHYYLWFRLVRSTTRPGSTARRIGTFAVLATVVILIATLLGARGLPLAVSRVLVWPGYLWLAVMFYLLVTLIVGELLVPVGWLARRGRNGGKPADLADPPDGSAEAAPVAADRGVDASRRLLLRRSAAIAAGLVSVGSVGYGVTAALGPPALRRVDVRLAKLPRRLDGLTIALASDIHLGPVLGQRHTERIVDAINGAEPDIIAVVGDLADGSVADLRPAAEPLRRLIAPMGGYFVTGNHEYYSGYQEWIEEISSLGLRVLRNERVELDGIDLAGVNDASGGQHGDPPDYDRALAGRDVSRPVVLLAHQPTQARQAARRGVDLQLSGHTHDGQMWPFTYVVAAMQPVAQGLGEVDGMPVYVSRGAGFWGPPVRVGAPPDISLITLRAP